MQNIKLLVYYFILIYLSKLTIIITFILLNYISNNKS